MEVFARWLVRHPVPFLVANLALGAALLPFALKIRIETALETVLPADDPAVAEYQRVREVFGSDDVAVVGVLGEDVLLPATLEKIARLTTELAAIDGALQVISLTNAVDPAEDVLSPPKFFPDWPPRKDAIEAVRAKLSSVPVYGRNLVSPDFRGAAITVFFENLSHAEYVDRGIDAKLEAVVARHQGPERLFLTGAGHVTEEAIELLRRDLARFTPLAIGLVVIALWGSFRTVRGVLLPLSSVLLALAWTLGMMVLAGRSLTLGTFVLPPLLLVVGSSYAVHVMARYYEQVGGGTPPDRLVYEAYRRVWVPLAFSAGTTAIGFGSLLVSSIPAIRELGLFAVVGVGCLAITSLTWIPAALALLPAKSRTERSGKIPPRLIRLLAGLAIFAGRRRRAIFAAAILLALAGAAGTSRIRVDSDFLAYFKPGSPVRIAHETINREIVGTNVFYLVVRGDRPGALEEWEAIDLVHQLRRHVETLPGVASTISIVDYLELFEKGLAKGGAEGDVLLDELGNIVESTAPVRSFHDDPQSLGPILEILKANPAAFCAVVNEDFSMANVLVRTRLSGSREIEAMLAKIREWTQEHFPPRLEVHPTGSLVLLTGTASEIVAGQIHSLGLALVMIFALMSAMFLSLRIGFLAMLPNVLPVALFFGLMGLGGVLLNLGTSLIAAISLGIAVDSTIHYMSRLNLELRGATDQTIAVRRALETAGVPVVYATATLFLGFLIFSFSGFVPIQQFGVLAAVTMAASLPANLILLPALLSTTRIITLWDLLALRLGDNPTATVPLFAGLRPSQARVVVLMGRLRRFAAGEAIVRRGESGQEMFVVIRGRVEVSVDSRKLVELGRGASFGEMALVRHAERSADVFALEPVEVLAVDERFLERIQARYPRIASKVFLNLTRLVSDRLERVTEELSEARGTRG